MRAAQEAIQASEERYRITSELTNDYIYSVRVDKNKDFTLEWATDAFERLTGYSPAELAEQGGWGSIVHPDDTETYNQARAELLATGKSDVVEYRILTKSGETRWLRDHRAPKWDDAAGRVVSLLGASYDVTTRIESQLELQKLASIVENSNDAIFSASLDGIVQSWNPAAQAMFGYTAAEAIGQTMTELIARDRADEALNMYEMVADGQNIDSKETLRITKDGRSIEIAATLSPIRDEKGEVTAVSAILRDITVQKHAERELHKAKNEAEAANHAKSAFLANMSHELRTPLNAILGFTQLIARDQTLPPEQEEHLSIISRSGEHLLALINDILEVSKIEAGRTKVTTTAFDLHKLLEDLENMFTLKAERKKIRLLFEQDPTTPHYIQADESKIRQVLINLINNAIKFTHEGGVTVRIRGRGKQDPNLCLEIQDTGAGIEPEALDTLFDAFTQSQTGQKSQEGTGLGLSISQQFVQLMGGDLRVESEPGTGSIFSFEIPIEFAAFEDIADTTPSRRVIGVKPDQPTQRLLIVEDRVENRKLLTSLLRPFGFELREAVNGKEALEVWEDWEPNLIWMDMRMPVMDGYETTRRIKSTTKGQSTVIIAITASAFEEDRDTILSAGSDDFVRKPFRENEIFDMLAKHLDVQFEYEEFAAATDEGMFIRDVPTQIIRTIPRNLLTSIHNATIEADIDLVMAIIEEIRAHNPDVAHALTDLARNFQYDTLIDLTQPE
jgi:PAS domain S-box-containing protein